MDVKLKQESNRESGLETVKYSLREHLDKILLSENETTQLEAVRIKIEPIDVGCSERSVIGEVKALGIKTEPLEDDCVEDETAVEEVEGNKVPIKPEPQDSWSSYTASSVKGEKGGSCSTPVKLEPEKCEVDTLKSPSRPPIKVEPDSAQSETAGEPVTGEYDPKLPESTVKQEKDQLDCSLDQAGSGCSEEIGDPAPAPSTSSCDNPNEAVRSHNTCSVPEEIPSPHSSRTPNTRTERQAKKKAQLNLREDEGDFDSIEPTKKARRPHDYGGKTRHKGVRQLTVWGYQPDMNELKTHDGVQLKPCFVKVCTMPDEILVKHGLELDVKEDTSSVKQVDFQALKNWLYSCSHCDYHSNYLREFRLHGMTHTDGTERIACPDCGYSTVSNSSLYAHRMAVHRKGKTVQCSQCYFQTDFPFKLKAHRKTHIDSTYKCDYCDYTAKTYAGLKSHTYTHTGEKPYACYHCSYRARQLAHLRAHISIHFDVKPFQCSLCDHKTRQKSQLRQHMRFIHNDERPLTCNCCGNAFKTKQGLESHILCKHTLEEPYSCKLCSFKTAHSSILRAHLKGHQEKYKFPCQHCSWSTGSSRARTNHILKSHPEKVITLKCYNCDFRALERKLLEAHKISENH